jgi:hypothetical protein
MGARVKAAPEEALCEATLAAARLRAEGVQQQQLAGVELEARAAQLAVARAKACELGERLQEAATRGRGAEADATLRVEAREAARRARGHAKQAATEAKASRARGHRGARLRRRVAGAVQQRLERSSAEAEALAARLKAAEARAGAAEARRLELERALEARGVELEVTKFLCSRNTGGAERDRQGRAESRRTLLSPLACAKAYVDPWRTFCARQQMSRGGGGGRERPRARVSRGAATANPAMRAHLHQPQTRI